MDFYNVAQLTTILKDFGLIQKGLKKDKQDRIKDYVEKQIMKYNADVTKHSDSEILEKLSKYSYDELKKIAEILKQKEEDLKRKEEELEAKAEELKLKKEEERQHEYDYEFKVKEEVLKKREEEETEKKIRDMSIKLFVAEKTKQQQKITNEMNVVLEKKMDLLDELKQKHKVFEIDDKEVHKKQMKMVCNGLQDTITKKSIENKPLTEINELEIMDTEPMPFRKGEFMEAQDYLQNLSNRHNGITRAKSEKRRKCNTAELLRIKREEKIAFRKGIVLDKIKKNKPTTRCNRLNNITTNEKPIRIL